ncbi:MAG: protein kinase domain-containing protein [Planctomycetota bacterium]
MHPPLPAFQAAVLIEKCARALAHAHARGIIHRDLKPGNILMRSADDPVLLDFGLARQVNLDEDPAEGPASRLTMMGQVLGTPAYMSPEQARGEIDLVDEQSDTYSLGAILYEMLTGREVLSPSRTIGEALQKIQTEEPTPPSRLVKRIPGDLETITLKSLRKERSQRYANAEAFAEDLRRLREGEPILARRQGLLYRTYKFVEKRRVVLTVASVVTGFFLILLGTVVYRGYQQQIRSNARLEQGMQALQAERATKEKAETELENVLRQLYVHEFSTDFAQTVDLDSPKSHFEVPQWTSKSGAGVGDPTAGFWRVLRGRLNGRAGVRNSAARCNDGLLLFKQPLVGDVTIEYEISVNPLEPWAVPEIAFVLNAESGHNTDVGYFVSIQPGGVRVSRMGADVHGGPGYAGLEPGERYRVRIEKVSDRLIVQLKPAAPQAKDTPFTTVVDFRDPDPVSGEGLDRFGWYIWKSEVQIFNFSVTRPVPARPRPIHFAHKLFNRGEYAMAREEYQEVSRIGFGTRQSQADNPALRWIQDDGVEADFRTALCSERLADRETDPTRGTAYLGAAEAGYTTFLYEHTPPPPGSDAAPGAPRTEEYPDLHALALAHLAICYLKNGWPAQADEVVQKLEQFSATTGPDAKACIAGADSGWSVLAEYALFESARAEATPISPGDNHADLGVLNSFQQAADFARRIQDPKLSEEKAKSILRAIQMSFRLDRNNPIYILRINLVYQTLGKCSFTSPAPFVNQLAFHEEDTAATLEDCLLGLAEARHAMPALLATYRVARMCDLSKVSSQVVLKKLTDIYDMPGGDVDTWFRCGEKACAYQDFELAHKFFERALRQSTPDSQRKEEIYRGLGSAMYDNGESSNDPKQRIRGMADLLAAADFAGSPDVLDAEYERVSRFIEDHAGEAAGLQDYLRNTLPPALAARRWGLYCLCAGRFDEARSALKASFDAEPQHPFTLYLMAVAASHAGEPTTAAQLLERTRTQWPSTKVLDSLAALDLALEDYPAALKVCEQANDERPFNETATGWRAFALARLGRWPEAVAAAQLGRELDYSDRASLVVLMAYAVRRGQIGLAGQFQALLASIRSLSDLPESKIHQRTRIQLPREIGFANVTLANLSDCLPDLNKPAPGDAAAPVTPPAYPTPDGRTRTLQVWPALPAQPAGPTPPGTKPPTRDGAEPPPRPGTTPPTGSTQPGAGANPAANPGAAPAPAQPPAPQQTPTPTPPPAPAPNEPAPLG